jgi:arylformamidase
MTIYDITRPLSAQTAVYPGDPPVTLTPVQDMRQGDACNVSGISMSLHAGTHIDAPRHYAADAPGADALDLNLLIGPARVVTLDAGDIIALAMVQALELQNVRRLLLHTRASGPQALQTPFDPTYPSIAPAAAAWMGQQGLGLIGTDAPSVDPVDSVALPAHHAFHRYGVLIIENLYLRGVPDGDYELVALPLKVVDGDAAPARVILRS